MAVMIETRRGYENVEAIIETPGVGTCVLSAKKVQTVLTCVQMLLLQEKQTCAYPWATILRQAALLWK